MRYRDFGKVIEEHATKNGFSVVRAFVGHGINQLFHCAPNVPHYASKFSLFFHGATWDFTMIHTAFLYRQQGYWCL